MRRKAILAVVCWLTLSEASSSGETEKSVNDREEDSRTEASEPQLYRFTQVYASGAPYGAYSYQAPTIVSAPLPGPAFASSNLRDSYGHYIRQGAAYQAPIPQQFLQLQALPAHLAQPFVAEPRFKQSEQQYFLGSQSFRIPPIRQAATPTPVTSLSNRSQPLVYAGRVYSNIRNFAPISSLRGPHGPTQATQHSTNTENIQRPQEPQSQSQVQGTSHPNLLKSSTNNQNGQIQAAPAQTSVTAIVNGKKTVITLDTKPPLPLLDLDLLEPLTFANPVVPQVQNFLPRINTATYHKLPSFNIKNHSKGNGQNGVKKTKSYEGDVIVGKPKAYPPKKQHNKPKINYNPSEEPNIMFKASPNDKPDISYVINKPGYKETYNEKAVSYNKETNPKPVSYSYNMNSQKEPVTYSFSHSSKEPLQVQHVEYESDPNNPKQLIYKLKPEEQKEEEKEHDEEEEDDDNSSSSDSEDSGESSESDEEPSQAYQEKHNDSDVTVLRAGHGHHHGAHLSNNLPSSHHRGHHGHHEDHNKHHSKHHHDVPTRHSEHGSHNHHEKTSGRSHHHGDSPKHHKESPSRSGHHKSQHHKESPKHSGHHDHRERTHDHSREHSREHSRDHSREHSRDHSRDHPRDHPRDHSRDHHSHHKERGNSHHHKLRTNHNDGLSIDVAPKPQNVPLNRDFPPKYPQNFNFNDMPKIYEPIHFQPLQEYEEYVKIHAPDYHNPPLHAPENNNAPFIASEYHNAPVLASDIHNAPGNAPEIHNTPLHAPEHRNAPLQIPEVHNAPLQLPEFLNDPIHVPEHQNAPLKVDPSQHVQLGPSTSTTSSSPYPQRQKSAKPQKQNIANLQRPKITPDLPGVRHKHSKRPPPPSQVLEKSKTIIIKEDGETHPEAHSDNQGRPKEIEQWLPQMEDHKEELDFEKAYKESAFGFPAYEQTANIEKDIYNPKVYGEPQYYKIQGSPFEQYQAAGDEAPKSARLEYKDDRDKTKEKYFLEYAVHKPTSFLDRFKNKEDYFKGYKGHRHHFHHGKKNNEKQAEQYVVAPSFSYSSSTSKPLEQYVAQYVAPLRAEDEEQREFDFSKGEPRDSSAFGSRSFQNFRTRFVEPQYQYGFEPMAAPLVLDSELAAMASNHSPEAENPGLRKKVYKENWYIKKTSTTAGKPS